MARGSRPVYVISIAASLAGCHPRTLRIYEEEGLVDPVRTHTNIRLYSDDDVKRVRGIRYLTQIRGVNLAGVKLLLQFRDIADLLEEISGALDADLQEGDGGRETRGFAVAGGGRTAVRHPTRLAARDEGRSPLRQQGGFAAKRGS